MKAAATALSLIGRIPDRPDLVADLTALAHEEMRHFQRVLELLNGRGLALGRVRPDRYVSRLKRRTQRGRHGIDTLLDLLIPCAFVEARSCERFRLLAEAPSLPAPLRSFYGELASAEARHFDLFIRHARSAAGDRAANQRIDEIARIEAEIVSELPHDSRVH